MSDVEIINEQISDQIEGRIRREVRMAVVSNIQRNGRVSGKTSGSVKFSIFSQDGYYFSKSEEGLGLPVKITEEVYNALLRISAYPGNSWEFESQYLGIWGFDWASLER